MTAISLVICRSVCGDGSGGGGGKLSEALAQLCVGVRRFEQAAPFVRGPHRKHHRQRGQGSRLGVSGQPSRQVQGRLAQGERPDHPGTPPQSDNTQWKNRRRPRRQSVRINALCNALWHAPMYTTDAFVQSLDARVLDCTDKWTFKNDVKNKQPPRQHLVAFDNHIQNNFSWDLCNVTSFWPTRQHPPPSQFPPSHSPFVSARVSF